MDDAEARRAVLYSKLMACVPEARRGGFSARCRAYGKAIVSSAPAAPTTTTSTAHAEEEDAAAVPPPANALDAHAAALLRYIARRHQTPQRLRLIEQAIRDGESRTLGMNQTFPLR